MARLAPLAALLALASPAALAADSPAADPGLARAVERLAASVDRLAADADTRRVEVAVGILGLRMRKVERLESEIRGIGNEQEDHRAQLALMRQQLARSEEERRRSSDPVPEDPVTRDHAQGLRFLEDRIRLLEERKIALQGELAQEQRGLARLEAILDDWLEAQR